jgi:hypothetical protein
MAHQPPIVEVVAPERLDITRELETLAEAGEQARDAGVKRVTTAMDDLRIWEQPHNQPQMHEVEWHLVCHACGVS